jgi:predicted nucleotidyltransferase
MSDAEIRAGLSGEAGSFLRGLLLTIGAMEVVLDPRPLPASTREWCTLALAEMHASANALRALGVRIPTEVRIPGLSPDAWHARRRSSNANRLGARLIELQPRESTLPPGVLDRIVQALQPEQIWLFGSRARGTAAPESDWDLLVVVADSTTKGLDRASIWAELGDLARYRVEVFPIRRSDFEAERHQLGTLAQIAKSEGYLVHDR